MSTPTWAEFSQRRIESAKATAEFRALKYHHTTPAALHRQLVAIDKALTKALQVLLPLDLKHREGQDLETKPFNWPLMQELCTGHFSHELLQKKIEPARYKLAPAYPTQLLADLEQLRDVAREGATRTKPTRGQSTERNTDTRDASRLARDYVFHFRATFGFMPPMSSTGPGVELLQQMLDVAGLGSFDAARLLQTAIERDEIGRSLPPRPSRSTTKKRLTHPR